MLLRHRKAHCEETPLHLERYQKREDHDLTAWANAAPTPTVYLRESRRLPVLALGQVNG